MKPALSQPDSRPIVNAGADVHRARQCADGHGARCRCHAREHGHARAHVHVCEPEPIHACVHGCGHVYENGNPSWAVLLIKRFLEIVPPFLASWNTWPSTRSIK